MAKFLELCTAAQGNRSTFQLTPNCCVGPPDAPHMFGGVGLAIGALALERACGRQLVCASACYVSYARCGEILDVDVEVLADGRHITQAIAIVRTGERVAFRVLGALGNRPGVVSHQWSQMPNVGSPETYPVVKHWSALEMGLHSRLEVRPVKGRYGRDRCGAPDPDGRLVLWVRPKDGSAIDLAFLAVLADLVPAGIGNALGMNAGGNSLDNTLRVLGTAPTDWVLVDILIDGIENGFAHGALRLFAQGGRLLATASQSLIVRIRESTAS